MTDVYEIRLKEYLDNRWSNRFEGFALSHQADGSTLLIGSIPDQAALHGVLMKVRDLGLTLLAVGRAEPEQGGGKNGEEMLDGTQTDD
jgi:hypothetical protein